MQEGRSLRFITVATVAAALFASETRAQPADDGRSAFNRGVTEGAAYARAHRGICLSDEFIEHEGRDGMTLWETTIEDLRLEGMSDRNRRLFSLGHGWGCAQERAILSGRSGVLTIPREPATLPAVE